jgi:hypothetical protein
VIQSGGLCKLGVSSNPIGRLFALQRVAAHPLRFAFLGLPHSHPFRIETGAHAILARHRVRGEWFEVSPELAIAAINEASGGLGLEVNAAPPRPRWCKLLTAVFIVPSLIGLATIARGFFG